MGRHVETTEYAGMVRRVLRALGRRAADDVDALAELVALREELDRVTDQAARDCHTAGYSWTEIGTALGTSRQNARQRFSAPSAGQVFPLMPVDRLAVARDFRGQL